MKNLLQLTTIFLLLNLTACSQSKDNSNVKVNLASYEGDWIGKIKNPTAFSFDMILDFSKKSDVHIRMSNGSEILNQTFVLKDQKEVSFQLGKNTSFNGQFNEDKSELNGFMKSGTLFYKLKFVKNEKGQYSGRWNFYMVNELSRPGFYMSIENVNGDNYEAYPFFADQRFRGTWAANFQKKGNQINFYDFRGGLEFKGKLLNNKIELEAFLGPAKVLALTLTPTEEEWDRGNPNNNKTDAYTPPSKRDDGWEIAPLGIEESSYTHLNNMMDSIYDNSLTYVHSVLIAKNEKLVFEKYFYEHDADVAHDQRSAAKSVYSAMMGIAIDQGVIKNVDQSIYDFLPEAYQYTKDEKKAKITLADCLTMSSGIDAVDFGTKRQSVATEDNYQNSPDWAKTVLEAPMIHKPGTHANYGSANPYLLGLALGNILEEPLETYIDKNLMQPLGISNYFINTDEKGQVYFGGGMHLTPRDMLKFGQLYLNDGKWKGEQIISKKWVDNSFKNYLRLENTTELNGYGYLWWHQDYEVNGKKYHSVDARGAGGQYIAVFEDLDMVVVITGGNYRNGRYWQPEMMIREYILPAILE